MASFLHLSRSNHRTRRSSDPARDHIGQKSDPVRSRHDSTGDLADCGIDARAAACRSTTTAVSIVLPFRLFAVIVPTSGLSPPNSAFDFCQSLCLLLIAKSRLAIRQMQPNRDGYESGRHVAHPALISIRPALHPPRQGHAATLASRPRFIAVLLLR